MASRGHDSGSLDAHGVQLRRQPLRCAFDVASMGGVAAQARYAKEFMKLMAESFRVIS
jgi:hypothetical protein